MATDDTRLEEAPDPAAQLATLALGAQKVLDNATALRSEALALKSIGGMSRALLLFQISLEECAKVDLIGTWAVSLMMGAPVDMKAKARAFSSHKAKNHTNAYMLPAEPPEIAARQQNRWSDALAAFKGQQRAFHESSNTAKNASLYVDYQDGEFHAPDERITPDMVEKIAATNEQLLSVAGTKTRMLHNWQNNPEVAKRLFAGLAEELEELRDHVDGPEAALSVLMETLFARADASGYADIVARRRTEGDGASKEARD